MILEIFRINRIHPELRECLCYIILFQILYTISHVNSPQNNPKWKDYKPRCSDEGISGWVHDGSDTQNRHSTPRR